MTVLAALQPGEKGWVDKAVIILFSAIYLLVWIIISYASENMAARLLLSEILTNLILCLLLLSLVAVDLLDLSLFYLG